MTRQGWGGMPPTKTHAPAVEPGLVRIYPIDTTPCPEALLRSTPRRADVLEMAGHGSDRPAFRA